MPTRATTRLVTAALVTATVGTILTTSLPASADSPGECTARDLHKVSGTYLIDSRGYLFGLSGPRGDYFDRTIRTRVTVTAMRKDGPLWPVGRYTVGPAASYRPNLDKQRPAFSWTAPRADAVIRTDYRVPGIPTRTGRCSFRLAKIG